MKSRFAISVLKTNGLEYEKETAFDLSKKKWCEQYNIDYLEITGLDSSFLGFDRNVYLNQKYQCIDIC